MLHLISYLILFTAISGCVTRLPYSTIDIHSHVETSSSVASLTELTSVMDGINLSHLLVMQAPNAAPSTESIDSLRSFFSADSSRFRFFYGGVDLNPLIHAVGAPNDFTISSLYPNGATDDTAAQNEVTQLNALRADASGTQTTFQTRATNAATSGNYKGFGEIAPLHFSLRQGHPYVEYSANHSYLTWLADLAATNNMVLDIHLEATEAKLTEFEALLSHNRNAKIIWDHAGWSNTGVATATRVRALLAVHSNLYLSLKVRAPNSTEMRNCNLFDEKGSLQPEWAKLIIDYSNRIMLGTDIKYFEDNKSAKSSSSLAMPAFVQTLMQLPKATAEAVANGTAKTVFGL